MSDTSIEQPYQIVREGLQDSFKALAVLFPNCAGLMQATVDGKLRFASRDLIAPMEVTLSSANALDFGNVDLPAFVPLGPERLSPKCETMIRLCLCHDARPTLVCLRCDSTSYAALVHRARDGITMIINHFEMAHKDGKDWWQMSPYTVLVGDKTNVAIDDSFYPKLTKAQHDEVSINLLNRTSAIEALVVHWLQDEQEEPASKAVVVHPNGNRLDIERWVVPSPVPHDLPNGRHRVLSLRTLKYH